MNMSPISPGTGCWRPRPANESYADVAVGGWVQLRIEVHGEKARLFLDGEDQPSLVVNDLRSGPAAAGPVALHISPETIGYFSDIRVRRQ